MTFIYGIDTTKEVTPGMVRNALIECFYDAHCMQTGLGDNDSDKDFNKTYCVEIVRKAFTETGGSFNTPSKEEILKVLPWLADFSKSFRDQETIKKHMSEIMELIKLLK